MQQMLQTPTRSIALHRGFTLLELLVVIAIIGILVAMLESAVHDVKKAATLMEDQRALAVLGWRVKAFAEEVPRELGKELAKLSTSTDDLGPLKNLHEEVMRLIRTNQGLLSDIVELLETNLPKRPRGALQESEIALNQLLVRLQNIDRAIPGESRVEY